MSQLNVDNIQNRTGSNGGPNFPSGITVAVGQTAYIHGNLQVDGTETIVNTETLNVADKTVGIGSTSNASNTTADGAGIEVFASSSQTGNNKTITWQNSSNAWTFGGGGIVATDAVVGSAVTINSSGVTVTGVVTSTKLDARGDAIIGIDQVSGNPGTTVGITTIRGHHVNSDSQYAALYLANSQSSGGSTASIRGERSGDNYGTNLSFYTNSTGSSGNGSERIRIGSSGQIGLGGANYGTSGQVITSAGSGSAPTWSSIPAGGNQIDLVADGAIAAGKPVVLQTDGKVKVIQSVTTNTTSPNLKSYTNLPSNLIGYNMTGIWHSTSGKGLIVYKKTSGGANQTRIRQFRLDSSGSISNVDNENSLDGERASNIKVIMDPDIDKPVTFWKRESDDNYVRSRVINIDGNGTNEAQASTAGVSYPKQQAMVDHNWDACYDTNANIFVFVYKDSSDSGKGKVRLGYQTEPSTGQHQITWINTDVEFSSDCESPRCEFDTVNNKVMIVWGQAGADVSACIGTVSGSGSSATISVGTRVVVNSSTGAGTGGKPKMAWNTTDGVFGFLYQRSDNNQNHLITLKTYGTTVYYNSGVQVGTENHNEMAIWYISSVGKFHWGVVGRYGWISSTGTATSGGSGSSAATVGSGMISIDNTFGGNVGDYEPLSGVDLPAHPLVTMFLTSNHGSDSGRLKMMTATIAAQASNAASDHQRLIGFAEDAISDGATGTIKLHGNVVGNQSGLTVASQYYIQGDGTIGTSADNTVGGIKAGTAISATKLLISDPRI